MNNLTVRKTATAFVLGAFAVSFSGCQIPFLYQTQEANAIVDEVNAVFRTVDSVLEDTEDLSRKVSTDALSTEIMSANLDDISRQQDELTAAKEQLEGTEEKLKQLDTLRLAQDYKDNYAAKVVNSRAKRLEAIDVADSLLFKSENLANAIVDNASAVSRLEQVFNKMEQIPEITFEDPQTIAVAQQILEEVGGETRQSQSEFNSAAASVNAQVFTLLRDSAGDLGNMADAADELTKIYALLLVSAENGDAEAFVQAAEQLPVQLEILVASLEQFAASFPADLVDDNGDLTTKAQNQVQTWKDENFRDLFDQVGDLNDEVETLDREAQSARANY